MDPEKCQHDWSGPLIDGQFKKCQGCGVIGVSGPGGPGFVPTNCNKAEGCYRPAVHVGLKHLSCKHHVGGNQTSSRAELRQRARAALGL